MDEHNIHQAVADGNLDRVRSLLAEGVPIDIVIKKRTALLWSLVCRHYEIVEFLLQNGANPNFSDQKDGWTPLHYAVVYKYIELEDTIRTVRLLLEHGANVNTPNFFGNVPKDLTRSVELITILEEYENDEIKDPGYD